MSDTGTRGRFPPDFMAALRQRTDIVELIAQTVVLRPAGREYVGLCPFHEERTPSFSVSRERQLFHCHGCHAGGDALSFVMRTRGLSFGDAVAELAAAAGLALPELRPLTAAEQARRGLHEELLAVCAAAAAYFRDCLRAAQGAPAIEYLRQRAVDGPTAEAFDLGYAPDDPDGVAHALAGRFPAERLLEAGLRVASERRPGAYDRFRGRLMFPIWDERGRAIAFGGRILDPAGNPKYLNSAESPLFHKRRTLYGLHLARPHIERRRRVVVVEGYMDAIGCHQHGFGETVASLGTALSDDQAGILARSAELVVIAYDADKAGAAATGRGLGILQEAGARVEVAMFPEGQDPDDLLRSAGAEAFGRSVDGAEPLVRYLVRSAVGPAGVGAMSPERRWAVAQGIAPYVARLPAGTRLEYAEWVARQLLVDPAALRSGVDRRAHEGGEHRNSKSWNATKTVISSGQIRMRSGAEAAEETVLAACVQSTRYLRRLLLGLSIYDFRHPAHKALVARLLDLPAGLGEPDAAEAGSEGDGRDAVPPGQTLLDAMEDVGEREVVARLLELPLPAHGADAVLLSHVRTMRRAALAAQVEELRAEDRRLAAEGHGIGSEQRRTVLRRLTELTAELAGFARGGGDG